MGFSCTPAATFPISLFLKSLMKQRDRYPYFLKVPRVTLMHILIDTISCSLSLYIPSKYYQKWGPAAHHSKANTEARLVERKASFISGAGNRAGEGGQRPVQRPTPQPPTPTISGQELLQMEGGGYLQKQYSQL